MGTGEGRTFRTGRDTTVARLHASGCISLIVRQRWMESTGERVQRASSHAR
jgi:hypothetical protein